MARQLDAAGIFNRHLVGRCRITHFMDEIKDELLGSLDGLSSKTAAIPLLRPSPVNGSTNTRPAAAYWWQNTRPRSCSNQRSAGCWRMATPTSSNWAHTPSWPRRSSKPQASNAFPVTASQRRDHDDGRTPLELPGRTALHRSDRRGTPCNTAPAGCSKLPSYPWQTKRYWNETQEAVEALVLPPCAPCWGRRSTPCTPRGKPNSAPPSTRSWPTIACRAVWWSPSGLRGDGPGRGERGLRSNHSVDHPVLHRAVIPTTPATPFCERPSTRTTAHWSSPAFTATPDGEPKWTITATAELNTLPPPPASTGPAGRRRAHHRDQR